MRRKISLQDKTPCFNQLQPYRNQLHKLFEASRVMSRIGLIDYNFLVIDYIIFLRQWLIYSGVSILIDYHEIQLITSLSISCSEVNKNTLINYYEYLIDYNVLELFLGFGKNTLIDLKDNQIDYFIELID